MHYENNKKVVRAGYAPIEEKQDGANVQPQQPVQETPDPEPEYEINLKIHCTNLELNSLQVGQWSLGRTEAETPVSQWSKEETHEKTSVLTAHCFQSEDKVLHHELFAKHHTTCFDVIPKPKGTKHINAEFIPVKLAIKAHESKLAFPTKGYFYHFVSGKLSREYRIAGEGLSIFQPTLSGASKLDDELLSKNQLTSVLLPYTREDAPVPDQHFLYRLEKLSQDQLNAVTTQWLDEHALKLEMDDIVAARTSALEKRPETEQDAEVWPPLKQFKAVHPFGDIWGQFKQHQLSETMVNVMQSHSIPDNVPVLILPVTKEEQLRQYCTKFDNFIFFFPNSPNFGEQGINLRAINEFKSYFNKPPRFIILTDDDEESTGFTQTVSFKAKWKDDYKIDSQLQSFYQEFGGEGAIVEKNAKNQTVLKLASNIEGCPTNASELGEALTAFSEGQAVVYTMSDDTHGPEKTGLFENYSEYPLEGTFTFVLTQEGKDTAQDKFKKLCPDWEQQSFDFERLIDKRTHRGKTLLLSGARDSYAQVADYDSGEVTEVHMRDKDHKPDKRTIYDNGKEKDYPCGIDDNAIYRTLISDNAIKESELPQSIQNGLNSILNNDQLYLVYNYGYHQVPAEHRQDLIETQHYAFENLSNKAVVLVVGDKHIPDLGSYDSISIDSPDLIETLNSRSNRALFVTVGRLPASVNNYLIKKVNLVLAEGKGSISIAQEFGVNYVILPQESGLKTDYHPSAKELVECSNNLYTPCDGAKLLRKIAEGAYASSYKAMCSEQSLILETFSGLYQSSFGPLDKA